MAYQVLYRAFRPGTFSEIVGQDTVVKTLRRQVEIGRIAHAYLFCGTRGTGKTTAAKVLSKAINCLHPQNGDPCGECEICKALKSESCMDVVEIDAASNNGVDEIRDLRDKVKYPPSVTRYKVYIIDEVHMLSTGAFNALLKTLEEPPKHAVFILATTEPQKLPATILSRCQRFDFKRIGVETIVGRLKTVLGEIHRQADDDALFEIARAAEGGMRDALSLLDSCLSYTDTAVTLQLARDVLGTAGRAFMFSFAEALIDYDSPEALRKIDEMMRRGCDPTVFCRDTVAHLRAILLAQAVGDTAELLEITPEDAQQFSEQAKKMSAQGLTRMMDLFIRAENDMKWTSSPRTMLELTAVRACTPEREDNATVSERIDKLEKLIESGAITAKKAAPTKAEEKKEAAPVKKEKPEREATSEPPEFWVEMLEVVNQNIPAAKNFLAKSKFLDFSGDTVTIEAGDKMGQQILLSKKKQLEEILTEKAGEPIALRILTKGDGANVKPEKKGLDMNVRKVMTELQDVFGADKLNVTD